MSTKCRQLRINEKGKKTPVCDASEAAKAFRRQCAHYIARILGVEEVRTRAEASTASQRDFFLGKRGADAREQDQSAARRLKLHSVLREEAEITRLEAETSLYVKEQAAKCEQLILQVAN